MGNLLKHYAMKKLILFPLMTMALFFVSCNHSLESKARKLIEKDLKTTMNDFSSYEFVSITKPDTVFSSFSTSEIGQKMWDKKFQIDADSFNLALDAEFCTDSKQKSILLDSIEKGKSFLNEYRKLESEYKSKQDGWAVVFTFRGNNSVGAKIIGNYLYYFDVDMTKITKSSKVD